MASHGFLNKIKQHKVAYNCFLHLACLIGALFFLLYCLFVHRSVFATLNNKPISVENVASLKTSNFTAGVYVTTSGYYKAKDGGSGRYIIRKKNEDDIYDGGKTIFLDKGNVAELIIAGSVNVKQFGAVGDSITDDTIAFENAISCAYGSNLIIPKGNYLIHKNLFADGVEEVIDNGSYSYIKPVYPHKEAFVKNLRNIKYEGTFMFMSGKKEWAQGLGVDKNTGNLLIAGVYKEMELQTLYRMRRTKFKVPITTYSYETLGHANTITHCPERGEYIIDDCSNSKGVKNYSIVNDKTMVAEPIQRTLPFKHFGISWDPVCKLFVCHHQINGNVILHICDINFVLLRTVTIKPSGKITLMNGGCCYDGVFFAPCITAFGEFSLLGEEIMLHTLPKTYELEDCDVYAGNLYLTGTKEYNRVDIFCCDGSTKNYAKKSLATFLKQ